MDWLPLYFLLLALLGRVDAFLNMGFLKSKELCTSTIAARNDTEPAKGLALQGGVPSAKLDVPFDDYGGRRQDPFGRGMGRKPPRARCHLSTVTRLQLVTVTVLVLHDFLVTTLHGSSRIKVKWLV